MFYFVTVPMDEEMYRDLQCDESRLRSRVLYEQRSKGFHGKALNKNNEDVQMNVTMNEEESCMNVYETDKKSVTDA